MTVLLAVSVWRSTATPTLRNVKDLKFPVKMEILAQLTRVILMKGASITHIVTIMTRAP